MSALIKESLGERGVEYIKDILNNDEKIDSKRPWKTIVYLLTMVVLIIYVIITDDDKMDNVTNAMFLAYPFILWFLSVFKFSSIFKEDNHTISKKSLKILFSSKLGLNKKKSIFSKILGTIMLLGMIISFVLMIYLGHWIFSILFAVSIIVISIASDIAENDIRKKYIKKIKTKIEKDNI